jgi:hypothetical protein
MHQAPTPDPEQPVIHVTQTPQFINQADGTIRAYYPGEDWYVEGATRAEISEKLRDEFDRRLQDPAYISDHLTRAKQHLYGGEVTPGFEVDTLSNDGYQQRMGELGDQVRTPKHRCADG